MTTRKTALVTGANKGIGFETARQLAQQGFTVWLGSRELERGESAAKELAGDGDVRLVLLDVNDDESVNAAAARISAETGALDVLVNNAAIAAVEVDTWPSTVRLDLVERMFATNVFGLLRVTQAFLPLVRRAQAGRIVNVSSTVASISALVTPGSPLVQNGWMYAYSASKTAVNTLTGALAVELKDTPMKVNSVCPGFNDTDMNNHQGTQHPAEGAKVVVRAATLPADGPTGSFFDVNGPVAW